MPSLEELKILYLSRKEVEKLDLSMQDVIDEVERVFVEKGHGRVEMPPKPGIHPVKNAFIHAMPASIPKMQAAGMKWVSGYPENLKQGLPYIMGLIVLNDPETGTPLAVMDASWVTAMRTGAATAVAARRMASPGAETICILGCGVQARTNLEAVALVCPNLKTVRVHDIVPANQERFVAENAAKYPALKVSGAASHQEAVVGADIVLSLIAIEDKPSPIIQPDWLKEGCFGGALAFDAGWSGPALASFDRIVTDDIGQLEYYRTQGFFKTTPPVDVELAEVVIGRKPGRAGEKERTMTVNLGLALEDVVTARKLYERALERKMGTWLPLW